MHHRTSVLAAAALAASAVAGGAAAAAEPQAAVEGDVTVWAMGTEGDNLDTIVEDFMAEFPDVSVGRRPRQDRDRHRRRRSTRRQLDRHDVDG